MKYLVTEIIKEEDVVGKFGPQKRTQFKVADNPNVISAFSKYGIKVDDEIDGTITQKDQWYNFKFAPKTFEVKASPSFQPTGDTVRLERKIDALLTELQMMKTVLGDILSKVDKVDLNAPPF